MKKELLKLHTEVDGHEEGGTAGRRGAEYENHGAGAARRRADELCREDTLVGADEDAEVLLSGEGEE